MADDFQKDLNMTLRIAEQVNLAGGETYFVGGYVRDQILGRENKDIDIEIHGITPDVLKKILENLGQLDERKVGNNFGILNLKGYDIDIAMPRAEKPVGPGHKDFIIDVDPFIGTHKAASRRDFTINALMKNVLTGEIIDHFDGLKDLEVGVVKHIDDKTFTDDPLRVLRAAQFAARFGFHIDKNTRYLASKVDLSALSSERVAGELEKALMKAWYPSIFFDKLSEMGQLDIWFPEVKALIDVKQATEFHPEGDVYAHTMLVLDKAAKERDRTQYPLYFMVAALCHDFGKPATTEYNQEKKRYQSIGHDSAGVMPAKDFVERIFNEKAMIRYVTEMVAYHMKPLQYYNNNSHDKKFMQLFDLVDHPEDLILMAKIDHEGRGGLIESFDSAENMLRDKLNDYKHLMSEPQVTGQDLIDLGYIPSPRFSEMLDYTHKLHLGGVSKEDVIRNMQGQFGKPELIEAECIDEDDIEFE